MDKLADYNIRRADQYHPVIQLTAGTVVDLVFLKGFYLNGQKHDVGRVVSLTATHLSRGFNALHEGSFYSIIWAAVVHIFSSQK